MNKPKVLFVDDDMNLLNSFRRQMFADYEITLAQAGEAAISILQNDKAFEVIVVDMNMPEMNGVQLLSIVKDVSPDTTRIMLTGNADQETAVTALNQGDIFRFLNKPCDVELLKTIINAGIKQRDLIVAERVLLSETLRGGVKVITDILSILLPREFKNVLELQRIVKTTGREFGAAGGWELDLASMFAPLTLALLPSDLRDRMMACETPTKEEVGVLIGAPRTVGKLISNIPRLERVGNILNDLILWRETEPGVKSDIAPSLDSQALQISFLYWCWRVGNISRERVLTRLKGIFEPVNSELYRRFLSVEKSFRWNVASEPGAQIKVPLTSLKIGHYLISDIKTKQGILMVNGGCELSPVLLEKIRNYSRNYDLVDPVLIQGLTD